MSNQFESVWVIQICPHQADKRHGSAEALRPQKMQELEVKGCGLRQSSSAARVQTPASSGPGRHFKFATPKVAPTKLAFYITFSTKWEFKLGLNSSLEGFDLETSIVSQNTNISVDRMKHTEICSKHALALTLFELGIPFSTAASDTKGVVCF